MKPLTEEEAGEELRAMGVDVGAEWDRLLVSLAARGAIDAADVLVPIVVVEPPDDRPRLGTAASLELLDRLLAVARGESVEDPREILASVMARPRE